jgi:hypothetical protein
VDTYTLDPAKGKLRQILEEAAEAHGFSLQDLTVLTALVDPYRLDTPAGHRDGEWLAKQLNDLYGPTKKAHWRGLHYAIVANGKIRKPDGAIYVNTDDEWNWLIGAPAKAARWLGKIEFDRIVDQRNSPAIIYHAKKVTPEARLSIGLEVEIPDADDIEPLAYPVGFVPRQAYHLVIFGEKSSLQEIVDPIAKRNEADLYLPSGEISDTLVYQMAKDGAEDGRPMVVFTLSDCDPAGWQMPVSIARKLQAFKDLFFPDLEFEVVQVALTPDQVKTIRPKLPETPLKAGENRADRWQEAFGVRQTEIDALTIPAKARILRRMLEEAIAPYIDRTLKDRNEQAEEKWRNDAQEAIDRQVDPEHLARLREEAAAKLEEMREAIDHLNSQLQLSPEDFDLPPIDVPQPEVDLNPSRQALVRFDDNFIAASRKLIEHKSYGKP